MGRSTLAWGLVAYGFVGLALSIIGFTFGLDAAGRLERLATASDATLEAAARSTAAAADSFASIDASLVSAESSVQQAATLSADAGETMAALSVAMNLSIFGAQPLQPLADEFDEAAQQAEELSATLSTTAGSVSQVRTDAASIGAELEGLAAELEALRASLPANPVPIRGLVALLIAYLTLPAVAALVAGVLLLGAQRAAAEGPPA
jgi:chromosome segregation ATPase